MQMREAGGDPKTRDELAKAHSFLRSGQADRAEAIYRRILVARPDDVEVLQYLALTRASRGDLDSASAHLEKALRIAPRSAQAHFNMGSLRQRQGREDEALRHYRHASELAEGYAIAHFAAGALLQKRGDAEDAVGHYRVGLAADPTNRDAVTNLSLALRSLGRLEEAADTLRGLLQRAPNDSDAFLRLGDLAMAREAWPEAIASFRECLNLTPGSVPAALGLAGAYRGAGDPESAIEAARMAVRVAPDQGRPYRALAYFLEETGDLEGAAGALSAGAAASPGDRKLLRSLAGLAARLDRPGQVSEAFARLLSLEDAVVEDWAAFADAVRLIKYDAFDPRLSRLFVEALGRSDLDTQSLAIPAVSLVKAMPGSECLGRLLSHEAAGTVPTRSELESVFPFFSQPLVRRLFQVAIIPDAEFEYAVTALRRGLLMSVFDDTSEEPPPEDLLCTLADHCLLNEYAYLETDSERAVVDRLAERLAERDGSLLSSTRVWAMLACYRRLADLDSITPILEESANHFGNPVASLLERHYREPKRERALAAKIERLTPISDETSQAVRQQYEENPYPRWQALKALPSLPLNKVLQHVLPTIEAALIPSVEAPRILVAGCGTGRHALMTASLYADSSVLAIDLSLASLAYAERKRAAAGIGNVRFAQADILELDESFGCFDIIESSGVLHHLADPFLGWRRLLDRLAPDGLMKVALYSEKARRHVVAARAFVAEKGYGTSPGDIRRCRRDIMMRAEDTLMAKVATGPDFFSLSPCRDLIFHVQEKRFTIPELEKAIQSLGLEFLGFEHRDVLVEERFRQEFPDAESQRSLACWAEFEDRHANTFAEMYNFWVRRPPPA